MKHHILAIVIGALPALAWGQAAQITIQDDFTQGHAQNNWVTYDGACLTAGDGTGTIPECTTDPYYKGQTQVGGLTGLLPDPVGQGALRLTNGPTMAGGKCTSGFNCGFLQAGGIVSNYTFNAGTGVNVIFKTVTYRGNSGGAAGDGADGMSFFLTDASNPYDMGAFGGSLGYTCSNTNNDAALHLDGTPRQYDGLRKAYLGLGIDEYGNFLNQGDNTATGYGYVPGRIGLRGAGSVNWYSLSHDAATAAYYPGTLTLAQQASAVRATCRTGHIQDYRIPAAPVDTGISIPDYAPINFGSAPVAYKVLPGGSPIANESAGTRGQAVPIAYQLKITQDGLLSFSYSYNGGTYQPVLTKQNITAGNGPLPAVLRFGFAGSTGGSTNIHEILCFQASPADLAATSVGVNEKEATKIASGTQAFLAFYYPTNWTGRLTANDLLFNAATNQVTVNTTANWDASCNLTGVPATQTCPTTGGGPVAAQGPAQRTMLTWNPVARSGAALQWGKLDAATQQATLDLGDGVAYPVATYPGYTADARIKYLRGDTSNEVRSVAGVTTGFFRARDSILGDIVDSSPTWVGPPINPYTLQWNDRLYPGAPGSYPENANTYTAFTTAYQTRTNVVYTGANDGLLHGFRAGSYDVNNQYSSVNNDGKEVLAFMPNTVLQAIHQYSAVDPNAATQDYSNTQYAHNFYVDATPATDDLYYSNAWHTWLVGGLGPGGKAIYALDVTNPNTFSENSPTTVIGEWTGATGTTAATAGNFTCANDVNCSQSLGYTYGIPVIRRLHNGQWAVIFGNGYGSVRGDAGIFVMLVSGGPPTFYYFTATPACTSAAPCTGANANGIASPAPADLDGDHITDFVYGGDLQGNVWRFDLTSKSPAGWSAGATALFSDPAKNPITTKLQIVAAPMTTGSARILVAFGTGRKIPLTNTAPQSYVSGTHNIYGIWDWNMSSWNGKAGQQMLYSSLAALPGGSKLQQQTMSVNAVSGALDATSKSVCWADQAACAATPQYGWYLPLTASAGSNEQVVFNPLVYNGALILNTTVPANNKLTSCKTLADTGNTIAISVSTGGALSGFFPLVVSDTNAIGGQTNGSGSPFIVLAGNQAQILTQTIGNVPVGVNGSNPQGPFACKPGQPICSATAQKQTLVGKRLTWIERR
ncbi:MAG: pilus assembly protein PilY [Proteobacteria bacterium]|nr:pilus assembly protein PilY [Pseudomonadota bacterium]